MLDNLTHRIDLIDKKIVELFEKRMDIVKKIAVYKKKHGLKIEKKQYDSDIIDKVTSRACDTEIIGYTEGLMIYLDTVSKKYQCRVVRQNKE
ncbi:MAG: chorismate mutase [Christensenellales bacterium]